MDRSKLQILAAELDKDIKTEADLNDLSRELLKSTKLPITFSIYRWWSYKEKFDAPRIAIKFLP